MKNYSKHSGKLFLILMVLSTVAVVSPGVVIEAKAATAAPATTPTITLTSPTNGTYINGSTLILFTVSNSNGTLFYNWDDNSNSSTTIVGTAANVTAPVAVAAHNLTVYAANSTGTGEWQTAYYEFHVENRPVITLTDPTNGSYIPPSLNVTFSVTGSNNTLKYNWDDDSNSTTAIVGGSAGVPAPATSGSKNLTVYTYNSTGGEGSGYTAYYEFIVESVTIALTSPVINNTYIANAATVTFTVTDSNGTLFYNWDDNSNSTASISANSVSVTAPSTDGSHNLTVHVYNHTYGVSATYVFTVQKEDVHTATFEITSTIETGYNAQAGITFKWKSWRNYSTITFYISIYLEGYSTILASKILTHSNYYAANGSISKSATIYLDHTAAAWANVDKDETLICIIRAYNTSTVSTANLRDSISKTDAYPFSTAAASTDSTSSTTNTALTFLVIGAGGVVILLAILSAIGFGASKGWWEMPKSINNKIDATRQRVYVRGDRRYLVRNRRGQIIDNQDADYADKQDRARTSKAERAAKRRRS